MILSIDMSLRSTGWVVIDLNGNLVDFGIIKTEDKDFDYDEDLIMYVVQKVFDIIFNHKKITQFVIEGLSFNGKNPKKDVIAGIYWSIRNMVRFSYKSILIGSVPVTSWRSKIVPAKEMKIFKKICKTDTAVKQSTFVKLPDNVMKKFLLYIEEKGLDFKAVFDITDAYWLAIYRKNLN